MTSKNDLDLEYRLSELELEVSRLKRELQQRPAQVAPPPAPAKRYTPPAERTIIHEKRTFDFLAKLPDVRKLLDFRATNHATGETLILDGYSVAQLTRACQQFSRLQFPNRRTWKGNRWLYGIAKKLFAHAGAIVQHPGSRKWSWVIWPHERRAVCARIVAALSPKK